MIDDTRQLRWYFGLGLLFFAVTPLLAVALLAADPAAPGRIVLPDLIGGPINVIGAVLVVRGMTATDPVTSTRLLKLGAAIIVAGNILLLVVRVLTA
jgi:hypothetical protein